MLDTLAGLPLGDLGFGGLLTVVVLLILAGRLVPRQSLVDARQDRDKWQQSAEDWQKAHYELGIAVEKLLAQGEATVHALTEIQDVLTRPTP